MTSDLLPCPFCGMTGETEVDCGGSKDRWWARCYNPKCLYDVSTNIFDTEAEAIAAWNTRPAPAGMAEIVAAAEAWVEAEKTCDEYCFHSVAQRAYARDRFFSLIAAHEAEVAKALEPLVAVAAEPDNEITSWPFWLVIDPRQTFSARVGDVASMIKGIFFSRKDADAHIEAKRHRYGSRVGVFCCSAHDSWQYKALYEASRAAAALRRRVTGG